MQQPDDDMEGLPVDLNRMLSALPRERMPDALLERRIAEQLRKKKLLFGGGAAARTARMRGFAALSWPAAAAAAAMLFVSGVFVGAYTNRVVAPPLAERTESQPARPVLLPAGDVLLAAEQSRPVARAIKF